MKWRYSLRWRLPRTPCPGPQELVSEVVEAGKPAPESVMARWVAGAGYAVCVDFLDERQLTAPRPKGRGFPLHGAEPKPLYAIQDLQALRGLTLPARQLLY